MQTDVRMVAAPGGMMGRPALGSMIDLEKAAEVCHLDSETLRQWTESGHVPHYFIADKGPFYRRTEVLEWVRDNLLSARGGMPVPRRINVLAPVVADGSAAPPTTIVTIESLCQLQLNGLCSGIYFLCQGDEVVYVGQSNGVLVRICSHIAERTKKFDQDRVYYLPCPPHELDRIEREYIALLSPRYNGNSGRRPPRPTPTEVWKRMQAEKTTVVLAREEA